MYDPDITPQIILYLTQELNNSEHDLERINRQVIIDYFTKSRGHCLGFAVLWVNAKRITDEIKTEEYKNKDDIDFFNSAYQLLLNFNADTLLGDQEKKEIERFISHVLFYQQQLLREKTYKDAFPHLQGPQLGLSLVENTKKGKPTLRYELNSILTTKDRLVPLFEKLIYPGNMIVVAGGSHAIAIYKSRQDSSLYFYDARSCLEVKLESITEVVEYTWKSTDPSFDRWWRGAGDPLDRLLRDLTIEIYDFQPVPMYDYPSIQAFNLSNEEIIDFL